MLNQKGLFEIVMTNYRNVPPIVFLKKELSKKTRNMKNNPRARGTNPRARGTNPRAKELLKVNVYSS